MVDEKTAWNRRQAFLSNLVKFALFRLNPHGHHDSDAVDYTLPSSMLAMSATMSASYHETLFSLASKCNKVYSEFLDSPEGKGFDGQVYVASYYLSKYNTNKIKITTVQVGR